MAEIWRLRIYRTDGSLLADFSTDSTAVPGSSPWLEVPDQLPGQSIRIGEGRARVGAMRFTLGDVPTVAGDQDSGGVTALLGDAEGRSQLVGLRAHGEYRVGMTWYTAIHGPLDSITQTDDFVAYDLVVKDQGEQQRRLRAFLKGTTSSVFPRGIVDGWGTLPNGQKLVPPVTPATGWFQASDDGTAGIIQLDGTPAEKEAKGWYLTPAMEEVGTPVFDGLTGKNVLRNLAVMWRPVGGGAWTVLENMPVVGHSIEGTWNEPRFWSTYYREDPTEPPVVAALQVAATAGAGLPLDGATVEVIVRHNGPPSADWPIHLEGLSHGQVLVNLFSGVYSPADSQPVLLDEAAALATMPDPFMGKVEKPLDTADGVWKWAEENLFRPQGVSASRDATGRVKPVKYALPPLDAVLVELDDTNCEPVAGWEQGSSDAVNVVQVEYPRYFLTPPVKDERGEKAKGDGLSVNRVVLRHVNVAGVQRLNGEKVLKISGAGLAALGGLSGEPVVPDYTQERGAQVLTARAQEILDRLVLGGQHFRLLAERSALQGRGVGDWAIVGVSWAPDYGSGRMGANRLAQIVSTRPVEGTSMVELELVDAGPNAQPVAAGTIGAPSVSAATGVITVPVTGVPAGGRTRVDYAVSSAQPAVDSALWTFLGSRDTVGSINSQGFPAGVSIWVRARGEAEGKRASAWGNPVQLSVPAFARIAEFRVEVVDGVAYAVWRATAATLGVRIQYDTHAVDADPVFDPGAVLDADASLGRIALPVTAPAGQFVTARITPYTGWTGSAVSGTAGDPRQDSELGTGGQLLPFGFITPNVSSLGVVSFDFSGNERANGFGWQVSKVGHSSSPAGSTLVAARSGSVTVPNFTLARGELAFITGWFLETAGDLNTAGERAIATGIIPGEEGFIIPVIRETVAETETTGTLFLEPYDPQARLLSVEFSTRTSLDAGWSAWAADTAPYAAVVNLDPAHVAFIRYRVGYTGADDATTQYLEPAPIAFDIGKKPDVVLLNARVVGSGAIVADVGGDSDVRSHKVVARTDRAPTLAEIRAGVTVNARAGATGTLVTLTSGQTAYVGSLAYSGLNGTGVESERADAQVQYVVDIPAEATPKLRRAEDGSLFMRWEGNEATASIRYTVNVQPGPFSDAHYITDLGQSVVAEGREGELDTGQDVPGGSFAYVVVWGFPEPAAGGTAGVPHGDFLWQFPVQRLGLRVFVDSKSFSAYLRVEALDSGAGRAKSFVYKVGTDGYPADDPNGGVLVNFGAEPLATVLLGSTQFGSSWYVRAWPFSGAGGTGAQGESQVAEGQAPNTWGLDPKTGLVDTTKPTGRGGFLPTKREVQVMRGQGVAHTQGGLSQADRARSGVAGIPGEDAWTRDLVDRTGSTTLFGTAEKRVYSSRLDGTVDDQAGRTISRMFAKANTADPDHADAVPNGASRRVTLNDEATGGGRGFGGFRDASGGLVSGANDSAGRGVVRMFAKNLSSDPDHADAIPNGVSRRVTTTNEATGGARGFSGFQNTSGLLAAGVAESGGKAINRLLAKPLSGDPDTADALQPGANYRAATYDEAAGGGRAVTAINTELEYTRPLRGNIPIRGGDLYVPSGATIRVGDLAQDYVRKIIRIPATDLVPLTSDEAFRYWEDGAGQKLTAQVYYTGGVVMPRGTIMRAFRFRMWGGYSIQLRRITSAPAAELIGSSSQTGLGDAWYTLELFLNETVADATYVFEYFGPGGGGTSKKIAWAEVEYDMPTYGNTY